MKIFIRLTNGLIQMECDCMDYVQDIKKQIEDTEFIPYNLINLTNGVNCLNDNEVVSNIYKEGDILEYFVELKGGMRQKWRKKRMRRMKRHRRKMRNRSK